VTRAARFRRVFKFLNGCGIRYALVGGIPAGIYGEPRVTVDVDLTLRLTGSNLDRIVARARRDGVDISVSAVEQGAYRRGFFRIRVAGTDVDFLPGSTAYDGEIVARARRRSIFGVAVRLASPEDVILTKLVSGRPVDLQDAKAIESSRRVRLDRAYIGLWAARLRVQRGRGLALPRWKRLLTSRYRA
jgi:hypothetical protein